MRLDYVRGLPNVVRFPVERRVNPTMELLYEIMPNSLEIDDLAEAFGLEMPPWDLEARTDAATAEHIAEQLPLRGPEREQMLRELDAPVIEAAVAACRDADDGWADAREAEQVLERAKAAGHSGIEALAKRAREMGRRAAVLTVTAYWRAREAMGVSRAVEIARRGEVWAPRDHDAEVDLLIEMSEQLRARQRAHMRTGRARGTALALRHCRCRG